MQSLARLPALDEDRGLVTAVIEAPRGARNKPKYDDSIGAFPLNKILPEGTLTVVVPSNAASPLAKLGVQFFTGKSRWSGTAYLDEIGW